MRRYALVATAAIGAAMLLARAAGAQEPTAQQILARAYERYAAIKDFQATASTELDMGGMRFTMPVEFAYRRPDDVLLSMKGVPAVTLVRNKDTRWTYTGMVNQYTRETVKPGEPLTGAEAAMFGLPGNGLTALKLLVGGPLVDSLARPGLLPEADMNGMRCYVIGLPMKAAEMEIRGTSALYFDKETMTLRAVEASISLPGMTGPMAGMRMRVKESYRDIKIDEGVPDDRFVFEPPKGAKLVKEFGPEEREKPKLLSKPAPDFKVKDLSGKTVRLADFRGKVLLLDFWATWCPPCRKEMPDIQRIYEQGKDKGLAVLAISDEEVKGVKDFLKKNRLSLPVAIDEGDKAAIAYGVEAIPSTFIIDGKGVVRAGFRGLTSRATLSQEIARLGVKIEASREVAATQEPAAASDKQGEAASKHREAGLKMLLLGRDEEAEKELRAAAEAAPDDAEAWMTLGEFYAKTSRLQEAREAFDHALKSAGENKAAPHGAAAKAYLDAGTGYDAALEHARDAVRLEPRVAEHWSTLGWACYQKGMYEQAVFNLKKALKLQPENAVAHFRLGAVYEKQGDPGLARMQYKDAVKFDPSLEEAQQALERLK